MLELITGIIWEAPRAGLRHVEILGRDLYYRGGNLIEHKVRLPPPHTYTTIKSVMDMSEAECECEVDDTSDGDGQIYYLNYEGKASVTKSAKTSMLSLLRSHSIDPARSYFITK